MLFRGSGVAIVTPFDEAGNIDLKGLTTLLEFHVANQTDAIIINGTTGEASTLTDEEKRQTIQHTVKVINHRIPVIAGTGSNNTAAAAAFTKEVTAMGVDGVLVVTPYYNKSSKRGLYEHFRVIAEASSVPVILYTVPSRTNVNIPVETVVTLAQIPNIVGIKDATADLEYTRAIREQLPTDFAIYSGNDDLIIPVMEAGGDGVISVVANVLPKETHEMIATFERGEIEKARKLQASYLPFIETLFIEANPIPVKAALQQMGLPGGGLRLPLFEAEDETKHTVFEAMKEVGL